MTTDSTSPLDPRDIIEQYADSELSDLSQPRIDDLDAEVSRLLDRQSSGSDCGDESGNLRQEQTKAETHKAPTEVSYKLTSVRRDRRFCCSSPRGTHGGEWAQPPL